MMMQGMGLQNPMFFIGIVEDNVDPRHEGRVAVRAFGVHGTNKEIETRDLPWAQCVSGNYDANSPVPPLNSYVFGVFLDGRSAQHPLVLGMIPSQYTEKIDPDKDGHGVFSPYGYDDPLSKGFRPDDWGLHQKSPLVMAEDSVQERSYIKAVNANRVYKQRVANEDKEDFDTWDQPPTAYAAEYPYNRVIETASHVIELDDTPKKERIMIHHKSGSYVQIDAIGTVTEKAEGDRYEINIGTKHESSGHSVVTINGNSHVYVKGNKTEEIDGDYKLIVRGTTYLTGGKSMFLNAGLGIQARASDVKIEANAGLMTLFGKNEIQFEAEKQLNFVSNNIKHNALQDFAVYATKGFKFTTPLDFHLTSSNIIMTATGLIPPGPPVPFTPQGESGTIGLPIQAGVNITAPTMNVAAANGSFAGIWNASALNAGVITASTAVNSPLVNATVVTATSGDFSVLGAPLPSGPVSYNGAYRPPVPAGSIPTIPLLVPPAVSNPVPGILLPFGTKSGWAWPMGNGDPAIFYASVLTSPFSFVGGVIDVLAGGGYGITTCQMPEPPSESEAPPGIVANGYYAKGFSAGFMKADE